MFGRILTQHRRKSSVDLCHKGSTYSEVIDGIVGGTIRQGKSH